MVAIFLDKLYKVLAHCRRHRASRSLWSEFVTQEMESCP